MKTQQTYDKKKQIGCFRKVYIEALLKGGWKDVLRVELRLKSQQLTHTKDEALQFTTAGK